jgi:enterochelin esterase family protein
MFYFERINRRMKHIAQFLFLTLACAAGFFPLSALAQAPAVQPALNQILLPGEDWHLVAGDLQFADGPCADAQGNLYFCEMRGTPPVIWRVSPGGEKTKFIEGTSASGLKLGPDGRLYACIGKEKILIAFDLPDGKKTIIAEDVQPNDLVVSHRGHIYFTETGKKQITFVDAKTREKKAVDVGINGPNGIALSPDQQTLAVSDSRGVNVWTFHIEADGSLTAKTPAMTLRTPVDPKATNATPDKPVYKTASSGDGMTCDAQGRYYVSSAVGVQIFAKDGSLLGILANPGEKNMTSAAFAGAHQAYLHVICGDKIFRRKVQATGFLYHVPPTGK